MVRAHFISNVLDKPSLVPSKPQRDVTCRPPISPAIGNLVKPFILNKHNNYTFRLEIFVFTRFTQVMMCPYLARIFLFLFFVSSSIEEVYER